jgi:ethanolamine ammonia-lyase large subunit
MTTLEALCYGLARKYDPFMVNNVTGFIGPETHLDNFEMIYSCLQDHFMGKLLGLPMGMAPCFTLHANIALEGQQMATQMLTAAGANFYMDVYLNTDRMLAYFDTSAHDNQTLREIYNKQPSPEYLEWALKKGIFKKENNQILRGENFGKPSIFANSSEIEKLTSATPALYGFENSGPRPQNKVARKVRINQAIAREAVFSELNLDLLKSKFDFIEIKTEAHSKEMHLNSPTLGSLLAPETKIKDTQAQIQLVVTDGLSAEAVHQNIPTLVPLLTNLLSMGRYTYGLPLVAKYGRVKLAESVLTQVTSPLVVILIGERPGGDAEASKSLSAYFLYASKKGPEYSVISNIYKEGGVPPEEAAALVYEKIVHILTYQANGNRLEEILKHEHNL